jgi:Ca2+-binding RTX toxin-like protein
VLTARGKSSVFEMPGEGTDVLRTNRNFLVSPEIEKSTATGGRRVELRSGDGRQTLIGNRAANVLEAGTGSDRVRGGRGGDRILLDAFGFDRVSGGKGGDSFVPLGTPANADRPAGLEDPPHRTAHRITDFHPRRGDRVVMRASVFGKKLLKRRKLAIVRDRNPRPRGHRATVLFDDRTGLVSFDRDGTGPISDKVAVVLPDAQALKRNWLEIRR